MFKHTKLSLLSKKEKQFTKTYLVSIGEHVPERPDPDLLPSRSHEGREDGWVAGEQGEGGEARGEVRQPGGGTANAKKAVNISKTNLF